jgi:large subunit ribosomal protein L22
MQAVAKLNNCPMSPRKMRLVVDQIRGQRVDRALNVLRFNQKPVYSIYIEKLLKSAIANWQQKNEDTASDVAELFVKEVYVNSGRVLKRLRPAPQGRGYRIRKRSNHVTLVVDTPVIAEVEGNELQNQE